MGPLLSNLVLEPELLTLIQEIFLVAQNSDDHRLQHYASWTVTFLRHSVFTEETSYEEIGVHNQSGIHESIPQGVAEDSLVMKLSLWLINVNYPEVGFRFKGLQVRKIMTNLLICHHFGLIHTRTHK